MSQKQHKSIVCPECGRQFRVHMKINERELLDGLHGECPGPFCGYRYFEKLKEQNRTEQHRKYQHYEQKKINKKENHDTNQRR